MLHRFYFVVIIVFFGVHNQLRAAQMRMDTEQNQKPTEQELKEFFDAANKNHAKVFELLEKYGKNIVNESNFLNDPILTTAASKFWTPEEFEKILQIPGVDLNGRIGAVFTPLTKAMNMILGGDPDDKQLRKVQMLIDHKVDVNLTDSMGFTPLITAAMNKQPKVLLMLLRAGASPEGVVKKGHYLGSSFWTFANKYPTVMDAVKQYNREMEEEKRKIQQQTAAARQEGGWQHVANIIGEYASPQIHIENAEMADKN